MNVEPNLMLAYRTDPSDPSTEIVVTAYLSQGDLLSKDVSLTVALFIQPMVAAIKAKLESELISAHPL